MPSVRDRIRGTGRLPRSAGQGSDIPLFPVRHRLDPDTERRSHVAPQPSEEPRLPDVPSLGSRGRLTPSGIRALLIHAHDEAARAFYERFDFEPSPTDPLHLFLLLKDLRRALR